MKHIALIAAIVAAPLAAPAQDITAEDCAANRTVLGVTVEIAQKFHRLSTDETQPMEDRRKAANVVSEAIPKIEEARKWIEDNCPA